MNKLALPTGKATSSLSSGFEGPKCNCFLLSSSHLSHIRGSPISWQSCCFSSGGVTPVVLTTFLASCYPCSKNTGGGEGCWNVFHCCSHLGSVLLKFCTNKEKAFVFVSSLTLGLLRCLSSGTACFVLTTRWVPWRGGTCSSSALALQLNSSDLYPSFRIQKSQMQ